MTCAGLNILIVSLLTVKFLADNAKAKAGRKVIEEDVRRPNAEAKHMLTFQAGFLYTI
jgi:hypothetical protein